MPPPQLNVTILNSTAVELSWNINSTIGSASNAENICFDIERNFHLVHHCVPGKKLIENIKEDGSEKGIYIYRTRARASGVLPGKWSPPVCVTFSPPLPLFYINQTIVKPGLNSIATLNLSIALQDRAQFIGICHIPKIQGVEVSIEEGSNQLHRYKIPENAMKHQMSFELGQESEHELKVSAKLLSSVGPGPEQVTYVYVTGKITPQLHS